MRMKRETDTLKWKREFVRSLVNSVKDEIIRRVDDMPKHWNGFELRQFIADEFQHQVVKLDRKRKREYQSERYQMPGS